MTNRLVVLFLVSLLIFAGCESEVDSPDESTTNQESPEADGSAAMDQTEDQVTELQKEDEVVGNGAVVESGDTIEAHYTLWRYDANAEGGRGEQLQSSHDAGRSFTTTIGVGRVIPGWDQGVPGMKEGGVRYLTIPPHLAYGNSGSPPLIGPGETLVFKIEVLSIINSGN